MTFNTLSEVSNTSLDTRKYQEDPDLPLPKNKVGIEIEVESDSHELIMQANKLTIACTVWKTEVDYSLREYSTELISRPLFGLDIKDALLLMESFIKQDTQLRFSDRTSVHIHMECIDMSPKQLSNFVLLYITLEEVLFKFTAPHRHDNIYCLPFSLSGGLQANTKALLVHLNNNNKSATKRMLSRWPKYSSMNLSNIPNIGTIEFRALDGTADASRILTWIKILMSIKKYSLEFMEDVNDIPKLVSGMSPEEYIANIMGEELAKHFDYLEVGTDLMRGTRIAQDIIIQSNLEESSARILRKHTNPEASLAYKLYGDTLVFKETVSITDWQVAPPSFFNT